MKYKVTVETIQEAEGDRYGTSKSVYEQTLDSDNGLVKAVVNTVNEYTPSQIKEVLEQQETARRMKAETSERER